MNMSSDWDAERVTYTDQRLGADPLDNEYDYEPKERTQRKLRCRLHHHSTRRTNQTANETVVWSIRMQSP